MMFVNFIEKSKAPTDDLKLGQLFTSLLHRS